MDRPVVFVRDHSPGGTIAVWTENGTGIRCCPPRICGPPIAVVIGEAHERLADAPCHPRGLFALPMLLFAETRGSAEPIASASATLSVVVPPRPLTAVALPGCSFTVTKGTKKAYCLVTIVVADPTLRNLGWRVTLSATHFSCVCGGTLPPNALTVFHADDVVVLNGQPVDRHGGPAVRAQAVGRTPASNAPLFVASPGFGNGAYSVTLTLRLSVPANTVPGTYVPTWSLKSAPQLP
jgi:hypothetical protein